VVNCGADRRVPPGEEARDSPRVRETPRAVRRGTVDLAPAAKEDPAQNQREATLRVRLRVGERQGAAPGASEHDQRSRANARASLQIGDQCACVDRAVPRAGWSAPPRPRSYTMSDTRPGRKNAGASACCPHPGPMQENRGDTADRRSPPSTSSERHRAAACRLARGSISGKQARTAKLANSPMGSTDQDGRSGRLARFEVALCLGRVLDDGSTCPHRPLHSSVLVPPSLTLTGWDSPPWGRTYHLTSKANRL